MVKAYDDIIVFFLGLASAWMMSIIVRKVWPWFQRVALFCSAKSGHPFDDTNSDGACGVAIVEHCGCLCILMCIFGVICIIYLALFNSSSLLLS